MGVFATEEEAEEDGESFDFAYTTGLYHSFQHPEVIVLGLELKTCQAVINVIGSEVKKGAKFEAGRSYDNVFEGFPCRFIPVSRVDYKKYLCYADWFYEEKEVPVLQCIWPDSQKRFPDDLTSSEEFRKIQPILAGRK